MDLDGFNLHAGVRIAANDDEGRERLIRYGTRPGFALGRLRELPDGRLAYRVRWSRGPSGPYRVMEPLEFLARLAAITPPPYYPLVRYHGVLAPASRWRKLVVPKPPTEEGTRAAHARCPAAKDGEGGEKSPKRPRPSVAGPVRELLLRLPTAEPEEEVYSAVIRPAHWNRLLGGELLAREPRIDWAKLLQRTFDVDVLQCPGCGGRLEALGVVTSSRRARELLRELGLAKDDAPEPRARAPTKPPAG